MDTLESMGWGPAWEMKFEPFADGGLCPGRVFAEQREIYVVQSQHGEALARVSGRMRHEARERAGFPAVGDWVAIDTTGGAGQSVIHALVPRLNRFSRKLAGKEADEQIVAANLDTLFLVTSLNRELNPAGSNATSQPRRHSRSRSASSSASATCANAPTKRSSSFAVCFQALPYSR